MSAPTATAVPTTAAPIATPAATTAAPITAAPTTAAPVTTAPVATTAAPTFAPVTTTAAPVVTTAPPVVTTAAPTFSPATATPTPKTPFVTTAPPSPATNSPTVPSTQSPTGGGGIATPSPVFAPPSSTPSPPAITSAPANSGSGSGSPLSSGVIIAIAAGGGAIVVIALLCLLYCCFCRPAKKRRAYESPTRRQSQAALLKASGQDPRTQGYGGPSRTPPRDNFGPPKPPPQQQQYPPAIGREQRAPPNNEWANQAPPPQWKTPTPLAAPPAKAPSEPRSQPESPAMGTPLQAPPRPPSAFADSHRLFTYEELKQATGNFSPSNLLGEGGFGKVFKGVTAQGTTVAVKQLTLGGLGGQGEREFKAEVEVISRVHHRHLVTLLGYCMKGEERLLVLEYMANGTLESNLHGKNKPLMDWAARKKVGIGAARGLAYLHEDCHPRIIHRDIKASNILMDEHFDAQVADFGLAKLAEEKDTHVTTRVMGTFGYLAPEYAMSGKLTEKSDVFSFGVVLLELISGRRPVDMTQPPGQESLVEWARPILLQPEQHEDLVDPRLKAAGYDHEEMTKFIRAAMLCIRSTATKRPRMTQVVRMLEDDGLSPDSVAANYRPTQRFDSVPFGGGPYMSSEYGSEAASSGEYSQGGYPSGPFPPGPPPPGSRLGSPYRSASGEPPSGDVTLDVIDEQRDVHDEREQFADVALREDVETGGLGRPAQVQMAQRRPSNPGSSLGPPPGRHSRQGSLTPPSPGMLRPPPGRSPSNAPAYGQQTPPWRSSRGSSDDFKQSLVGPSSSGSDYASGQSSGSAYLGNTIIEPERFEGEGR